MHIKGTFYRNFHGKKIIKIEVNGEFFTVKFSNGEVLTNLSIRELNHIVVICHWQMTTAGAAAVSRLFFYFCNAIGAHL